MSVRWDEKRRRFIVDYYKFYVNEEGKNIRERPRITLPESVTDWVTARAIESDLVHRNGNEDSESAIDKFSTVSEMTELYLEDRVDFMTEATYKNVKWTFDKHISKHLGNFRIGEIGREHARIYQRIRKGTGVCGRTVNKEVNYFMGFLRWCRTEHDISIPEFRPTPLPHTKKPTITLSVHEAIRLILEAETKYAVLFLVMWILGLRFSEATSLEWSDIDREKRELRVIGKGGTEKLLPIPEWFLGWFDLLKPADYEDGEYPKGLVFRSPRTGGKIRNVKKALKRACESAGIQKHVYPHLLRHTLATQLGGLNVNLKLIQLLLRHAQESTTADMYTHLIIDHLRPAQEILIDAIKNTLATTKMIKGVTIDNK